MTRERDHDFRFDYNALLGHDASGFHDGPHLHLDDARHHDAQADAAQTQHGVGFPHAFDSLQHGFSLDQALRIVALEL